MSSTSAPPAPAPSSSPPAPEVTTSVILPAYNEGQALPHVLEAVLQAVDRNTEVLVVDDGSSDNTAEAARGYPCRLVQHPANRGKGAAIQTGIAQARGRYLVVMDADATYPAAAIPQIVAQLADYDLVRCNRRIQRQNMPLVNSIGNRIFDSLLGLAHGLEGADHLSGLYGLRREAAETLQLESLGFDIEAEIGIKARQRGLRITSFPVDYQPRLGEKKLRPWRDGFVILTRIIALILLLNPLATFVLPGLALLLLTVFATLILRDRAVVVSYFGFDVNTFIIATLGIIASFQLMVFGLAAALYSVEAGYRPPRWLVGISSRPVRLGSAAGGFLLALYAALNVASLIIHWITAHAGPFLETRVLVLNATLMVWGLQILSAALFLSIFAGRLQRSASPARR
jgi:glycosyltransferase involved in cell wall biosynthesis